MDKQSRIHYNWKDEDETILESPFYYSSKWKVYYRIRLYMKDPGNMGYRILNKINQTIRSKFGYTNKNVLKRFARRDIMALGVKFVQEHGNRNRTFGLCKKGYTQKEHRKNEKK